MSMSKKAERTNSIIKLNNQMKSFRNENNFNLRIPIQNIASQVLYGSLQLTDPYQKI